METVQSLGDDTRAVVTKVKEAGEHGFHAVMRRNFRPECAGRTAWPIDKDAGESDRRTLSIVLTKQAENTHR